jgi:hypothetical protein
VCFHIGLIEELESGDDGLLIIGHGRISGAMNIVEMSMEVVNAYAHVFVEIPIQSYAPSCGLSGRAALKD